MPEYKPPNTLAVQRIRSKVQKLFNLNINEARIWCASAALVTPQNWLAWEIGNFEMPPANFQLVQLKTLIFTPDLLSISSIPSVRYTTGLPVFANVRPNKTIKRQPVSTSASIVKKRVYPKKNPDSLV